MRWLHAAVHRDRHRALIAGGRFHFGVAPCDPPLIICPRCGDWWFADLPADEAAAAAEAERWAALATLAAECPDHRHRFTVTRR